jgi:hypothetical protein
MQKRDTCFPLRPDAGWKEVSEYLIRLRQARWRALFAQLARDREWVERLRRRGVLAA